MSNEQLAAMAAALRRIVTEGDTYGRSNEGADQKVIVEFVSSNPNGPITVAGGRSAAIGDVLASLLEATGCAVTREYYINDALSSEQMINFGKSVFYRYLGIQGGAPPIGGDEPPDWLYEGDYVTAIAREIAASRGGEFEGADLDDPQTAYTFRALSQERMIAHQKADLEALGVRFDNWYTESSLHDAGLVSAVVQNLTERGHTFEKDGALWLRSTAFGDDKDRVLVRANGVASYIAGDAAYHKDKFDRGFDKAVNVWSADHAGYVARTKAVVAALGYDPSRIDVLLYERVRIVKDGELIQPSLHGGGALELKSDVIDEIGADAARIFFLLRTPGSALDIDLDRARKADGDNPVYAAQSAYARVLKTEPVASIDDTDLSLLTSESDTSLIEKLSAFPDEVSLAARERAPHRLVQYVRDLAALVPSLDAGAEVSAARTVLLDATRIVFKNAFALLGVSAPERM
ncbi:MAG: arginine--tRNA ligase [Capsulimonas sp.]|uniref:arginine--tRNA ligase n=1 Tax=Capsulimonas sp. TaxID=2494211 RepID=UPI003263621E